MLKSHKRVWIRVDLDENRTVGDSVKLYNPVAEGSIYESLPYRGVLEVAPEGFKIPIGEVVYVNYQAIDDHAKIDGVDYYICEPDLIVAWGKRQKAFNCLIVEPISDKIKSEWLIIPDDPKNPVTMGKVLSSDIKGFKKGDMIEYEKNIDWECLIGLKKLYYIQLHEKIYKKNGKLCNDYNEITPREEFTIVNGIYRENPEKFYRVVDGKYKGKAIVLDNGNFIKTKRYVNSRHVAGVIPNPSAL
jgi:hypothetical protein